MGFLSKIFNPVATAAKGWFHETVTAPERQPLKVYANVMAPVLTLTAVVLPLYAGDPSSAVFGGLLSAVAFAPVAKSWHKTGCELVEKAPAGPA